MQQSLGCKALQILLRLNEFAPFLTLLRRHQEMPGPFYRAINSQGVLCGGYKSRIEFFGFLHTTALVMRSTLDFQEFQFVCSHAIALMVESNLDAERFECDYSAYGGCEQPWRLRLTLGVMLHYQRGGGGGSQGRNVRHITLSISKPMY